MTHDNHHTDDIETIFKMELDINDTFYNDLQVIAIDEGQFFHYIVNFAEVMANRGKIVIIAALDGNFMRKDFNCICASLVPIAEKVKKLSAICDECKVNKASFSKKIDKENKEIEDIGGKDKYIATCRNCYFK